MLDYLWQNYSKYARRSVVLPPGPSGIVSLASQMNSSLPYDLHHFHQKLTVRVADVELRPVEVTSSVRRMRDLREKDGALAVYHPGQPDTLPFGHLPTIGRPSTSSPILQT